MSFVSPAWYTRDSDGFAPPTYGGALAIKYASFDYTDTTATQLFTLPAGAVIVDFGVIVTTAFNDTGTDLLNVGVTGDLDRFVDDLAGAAGMTRAGAASTVPTAYLFAAPLAEETPVYGAFTGQNGDASAGAAVFYMVYMWGA